eukprot:TRINITY_DN65954_c1_g1_i4.p1 TRINITY_DN65954_c1_g1~~TRINITY_DN65954_c1_g1_i4.p1  ORF type:complete len:574 (-),score=56.61 TRINITY_DN65954_c1_g1_i4:1973-3541(-)
MVTPRIPSFPISSESVSRTTAAATAAAATADGSDDVDVVPMCSSSDEHEEPEEYDPFAFVPSCFLGERQDLRAIEEGQDEQHSADRQLTDEQHYLHCVASDLYTASDGQYCIEHSWSSYDSFLGSGSFGNVFKVKDTKAEKAETDKVTTTNTPPTAHHLFLAAKRMHGEVLEHSGDVFSLLRELEALLGLNHENVLPIQDVLYSKESDRVYILTPLMATSLANLNTNKCQEPDFKSISHQTLLGTLAVHQAGLIHRDLKPDNVLISNQGVVQIADFGLSTYSSDGDKTTHVGTRLYRSPESLLGLHYGAPSDMWAVGCLLFELINDGRPLFQIPASEQTVFSQIQEVLSVVGPPRCTSSWLQGLNGTPTGTALTKLIDNHGKLGCGITKKHFCEGQKFATPSLLSLLNSLVTFDPTMRLTADQALASEYLTEVHDPNSSSYRAARHQKIQQYHNNQYLPDKHADLDEQIEALHFWMVQHRPDFERKQPTTATTITGVASGAEKALPDLSFDELCGGSLFCSI